MKLHHYLSAIALFFVFNSAHAQYGAVTTATAGTGRASIEATETPILNPAAIPFSSGYFFTTDFATIGSDREYTIGLTDNLPTTVVPTSLVYTQIDGTAPGKKQYTTQDMHLSFGNIVTKNFAFGLGFEHKIDTVATAKYFQTNLMMGTLYSLTPNLGFAIVAENMLQADRSVPKQYRLHPTTALGLSYNRGSRLRLKLDLESAENNSFSQPILGGGFESYWNRWVIFRLGAKRDFSVSSNQYGAGIGFSGPKFAVHYGYLSSPENQDLARHSIDLAVPVW